MYNKENYWVASVYILGVASCVWQKNVLSNTNKGSLIWAVYIFW